MKSPRSPRRAALAGLVLALAPAALASASEPSRGDATCTVKPITVWAFGRTVTTPAIGFPCP